MEATISLVRHGEKNGDQLTELGKKQIIKTVESTICLGAKFDLIAHSPSNRAAQCAQIAQNIIGNDVCFEPYEMLSPGASIIEACGTEEHFEEEFAAIMNSGGTVADALRIGKYPKLGRECLNLFLLQLAEEMEKRDLSQAICFSHSPYISLGGYNVDSNIPYHISVAGIVVYVVDTTKKTIELRVVLEQ